jgi:hypothetical protein
MNIGVKSEDQECTKNHQHINPHLMETKSHENNSRNFSKNQQENNLNFLEENLNERKINLEKNHEVILNSQSGNH